MRIVLTIVTACAVFGAAAVLDPNRVHLIVQWSMHRQPAAAYLLLVLEPLVIAGLAILAARLRQWMLPILAFAILGAVWADAPLEFGALLLATAIMSWPPRWSRTHLSPV